MTREAGKMDYNIILRNGDLVVDSLTVADKFGKEHHRVLKDIRKRIADIDELGDEDNFDYISPDTYFYADTYPDSYGRNKPCYYMNQKGFTFLVMSYTGKEATKYKLAYIEQFERMRQALLTREQPLIRTHTEFIREGLRRRPQVVKIDWETPGPDHYCFGIWEILRLYGYSGAVTMSFLQEARPLVVFYGLPYFEEVINYCAAKDKLHLGYILKVLDDYHPSEVEQMVDDPVFGMGQSYSPTAMTWLVD
ncbi:MULTISPECIES: Rha family transcriptional regulator [unclassified Streptococcus]|uniref:Rha family transcriptional regulator n=1 Tax=unclassified Streptococcus TaxID=2608887 RepID=UPI00359DFCD4